MSGDLLFVLFCGFAVASVFIGWRDYSAERRLAAGNPTEIEMRRWMRKARRAWGRKDRIK